MRRLKLDEEVVPHSGMYQLMCWLKRGVLVVRSWFRTSGKHICSIETIVFPEGTCDLEGWSERRSRA